MKNANQLPTTFSSTWATEVELQLSATIGIVIKSDRTGQRGSWSVHFRVLDQDFATGYILFEDRLDVQDDAWAAADELIEQLVVRGFDEMTGQDVLA